MPRISNTTTSRASQFRIYQEGITIPFAPDKKKLGSTCDLEARKIIQKITTHSKRIPGINGLVSKIASSRAWINDVVIGLHQLARKNPAKFGVAKGNALRDIDQKLADFQDHKDRCGDDLGAETGSYIQFLKDKKAEIEGTKSPQAPDKPRRVATKQSNSPNQVQAATKWLGDRFNDAGKAIIDYSNAYDNWSRKELDRMMKEDGLFTPNGVIKPNASILTNTRMIKVMP